MAYKMSMRSTFKQLQPKDDPYEYRRTIRGYQTKLKTSSDWVDVTHKSNPKAYKAISGLDWSSHDVSKIKEAFKPVKPKDREKRKIQKGWVHPFFRGKKYKGPEDKYAD